MTSTQAVEARVAKWVAQAEMLGLSVRTDEDFVELSNPNDGRYGTKLWIFIAGGIVRSVRYYPRSANQVRVPQKEIPFNVKLIAGNA
jgi:hypothetical protein